MNKTPTLQVGYIGRAHGLNGELGIRTFDPASEVLFQVERVRLRGKDGAEMDFEVDSVRGASKEVLMALVDIESRDAAEKLVGSGVFVFREELDPPSEGEYFQGDLIGLVAVNEAGTTLGQVEEVWNTGPVPNLVIRGEGKELIVPFVDEFVPQVDVPNGKLIVRPPEFDE